MVALLTVTTWIESAVTISMCSYFFVKYFRIREKTLGFKMIFMLNLSAWVFSVSDVIQLLMTIGPLTTTNEQSLPTSFTLVWVLQVLIHFLLLWTAAFAIFTYKIMKAGTHYFFHGKRFILYTLVFCVPWSCLSLLIPYCNVFGSTVYLDSASMVRFQYPLYGALNQFLYYLAFDVLSKLLPSFTTFYCYYKIYLMTKMEVSYPEQKVNLIRILVLAITPTICFLPVSIADLINMYNGVPRPPTVNFLRSFLFRFFGILTLMNYWVFLPKKAASSVVETDRSQSLVVMDNTL